MRLYGIYFFEIQFHITHLATKEINTKLKVLYLSSTLLNLLKTGFTGNCTSDCGKYVWGSI
jgi:hypothetical protein